MSRHISILLVMLDCVACRHDMQIQPKYTPLGVSQFFPDGRTSRPIPEGAIAFNESQPSETGKSNGMFLTSIPIAVTRELLQRGQDRFNIYCSPCHGRTGNGEGMIASRGLLQPADLNSDRVRNAPPGYLYEVIVNGYGAMGDYAYQIKDARDRWAIVAYLRALELSRAATLADVPQDQRPRLETSQ